MSEKKDGAPSEQTRPAERDEATPKGTPSSDRHDMETHAGRQEGREPPEHKES